MKNVVVVMPYGAPWSELVWGALLQITTKDTAKQLTLHRVDTRDTPADYLDEKIESVNRGAQIILADLTGSNPNVLIEVGIALALQTPILLIAQDRRSVPTHLKGRIVEEYDPNDPDSLDRLTTILLLRMREKMQLAAAQLIERRSLPVYPAECYSTRRLARLENYFRKARVRIDILTTNLGFLFEEYGDDGRSYFDDIREALDRSDSKTKIRVLTLDPESDFAAKRGKQLGYAPGLFRESLRKALEETKKIASAYPLEQFEVRTYDDFPNQIMFRIDDEVFHCVVAQPTQSRNHLTIKLDRRHDAVDRSFLAHFQQIWGRREGIA